MKETRITGKRISLRFPRISDADDMANILKDWEITKYTSQCGNWLLAFQGLLE